MATCVKASLYFIFIIQNIQNHIPLMQYILIFEFSQNSQGLNS